MQISTNSITLPVDKKILLHIMEYSRYENQFEVPFAISQEGIAEAIRIRRDNVPRAMKELKISGLVTEKVARVEGVYRKRKVYFLTNSGLKFIQELKGKLLTSEVLLKQKDGRIEPTKLSEVNIKARLPKRLGIIELLNNISSSGMLEVKSLLKLMEAPTGLKTSEPRTLTKDSQGDPKSKFVEYIEDAPHPRYFVGRNKELQKIKAWLDTEEHKVVVITGFTDGTPCEIHY
jgi:DNA-binding PadR family transcriptional regulator